MRRTFFNIISYLSVSHTGLMAMGILLFTLFFGYRASMLQVRTGFTHFDNARTIEYNRIIDEFQNDSHIILLAKGQKDSLIAYADAVKPLLENFDEWVASVHTKIPENFYRRNALKLLPPERLDNFGSMFYDPNIVSFLHNLNNSFEREYQRNNDALKSRQDVVDAVRFLDGLEAFVNLQRQVMDGESPDGIGQKAVDAVTFGETYMLSPEKDMILIMIDPTFNLTIERDELRKRVNGIEKIIKDISAQYAVTAGLTGSLVLGRDEHDVFTSEPWTITTLTLVGIFILFIISFRMRASPLLAIITVIVSVIWSMGISSYLIEYFNMMTVMMTLTLIGLGIDFSVHIISGYTEKRNQGLGVQMAMQTTLQLFGPGIMTGGIATGFAFLTLMATESEGMQEMGIMVGIGIIITMLATFIILPTLLVILERMLKNINKSLPIKDVSYPFLGQIAQFIPRYRLSMGFLFLLSTCFLLQRASQITVDHNYLNMKPEDMESIQMQDELIEGFGWSSDIVMFTSDNLDEVRELTKIAREMETTGWVESISDYLPDKDGLDKQYRYLRDLKRKMKSREIRQQVSSYDMKMYQKEIIRLEANVIELQDFAFLGGQDKVYKKAIKLVGEAEDSMTRGNLTQYINSMDTALNRVELTFLQQKFSTAFKSTIMEMANIEPLTLENLPGEIKSRFTGKSGDVFIINVYPEKNIWEDRDLLYHFTNETTKLRKDAAGLSPIFVQVMDIMSQDGKKAACLVIIMVFFILALNFRSLKYAMTGMVPLVFGIIWMTGIMQISGLQFTMMNILAVPLIIGVGIEDGVHIIHRWKLEKNLDIVYRSSGKAILLTSLTTMLGFGSLSFSVHPGLGNIGAVLFIGVGSCFLGTLFILPPLLGTNRKKS